MGEHLPLPEGDDGLDIARRGELPHPGGGGGTIARRTDALCRQRAAIGGRNVSALLDWLGTRACHHSFFLYVQQVCACLNKRVTDVAHDLTHSFCLHRQKKITVVGLASLYINKWIVNRPTAVIGLNFTSLVRSALCDLATIRPNTVFYNYVPPLCDTKNVGLIKKKQTSFV